MLGLPAAGGIHRAWAEAGEGGEFDSPAGEEFGGEEGEREILDVCDIDYTWPRVSSATTLSHATLLLAVHRCECLFVLHEDTGSLVGMVHASGVEEGMVANGKREQGENLAQVSEITQRANALHGLHGGSTNSAAQASVVSKLGSFISGGNSSAAGAADETPVVATGASGHI
jgi:hypothetical protein